MFEIFSFYAFNNYGHHLEIEQGRWSKTPIAESYYKICKSGEVGDEYHAVMKCKIFDVKSRVAYTWSLFLAPPLIFVNC
jgi:hypothetical protein